MKIMQWFFDNTNVHPLEKLQGGVSGRLSVISVLLNQAYPDFNVVRIWLGRIPAHDVAFSEDFDHSMPLAIIVSGLIFGTLYPDPEYSGFGDAMRGYKQVKRKSPRCSKCLELWKMLIQNGLSPFLWHNK